MSEKLLYVDDEPEILQSFSRQFGRKYAIDCAPGGAEALDLMTRQGPYAVVLSDMQMPGLDGIAFLSKAKAISPDTVRMMLTGANERTAAKALNEGQIFRFLSKPCPPEVLEPAIEAALGHHRLVMAERAMLANTLTGAIKILTDVLATVRPVAFGRTNRIRDLVRRLAKDLVPNQLWRAELAAMLSQVGSVNIPEEVLAKAYQRKWLSKNESTPYEEHPVIGSRLVANVPRLEEVAEIILQQNKCFDGNGLPNDGVAGEAIPIEARILKAALDFDSLLQSGLNSTQALSEMGKSKGLYDRNVLVSLARSIGQEAAHRLQALAT
jgi:response regulator RpfG family c-di-GMP phosphodiesterase